MDGLWQSRCVEMEAAWRWKVWVAGCESQQPG